MLKVGFIGLGNVSNDHVLGYLDSEEAQIVAVCDVDEDAGQRWLERWNQPQAKLYKNHEAMLEKETLDIVEILTPHHLHCALAVSCAEAKVKGVSVQKPMAPRLEECDQIINSCKRNGVKLRVYENFLFYPVYEYAMYLLCQGAIGEPISIRVHTMGGIREGAPWPIFWDPKSWRMDLERSGVGPLVGDDGFHKFALARWFMEREYEKIGAWIDADTPLDAPAMIRARFKSAAGDPRYAQTRFLVLAPHGAPVRLLARRLCRNRRRRVASCGSTSVRAAKTEPTSKRSEMSGSPAFPPIAVFADGRVTTYHGRRPAGEPQLVIIVYQLHPQFHTGCAKRRLAGSHG